uniref:G protein-coupled receptor n=1 Tax=Pristionchus pacificus TaxID=54126 RepID=A0A8R1UCL4_PRIPA
MNSTMNSTADGYCLSEEMMKLSHHTFESLVIGKIVPLLIIFGISGNVVNLSVLLDGNMRTRSNTLLANLAVTDIFFLLFMIPHCMAHYRWFDHSYYFRLLYISNKMHLIAMLNWASACAIWLVLAVSLERLVVIKWPLRSRDRPILMKPALLVLLIFVLTGLLTFYNHFAYFCPTKIFCNGTQPHAICIHSDSDTWIRPNQSNPNPMWFRAIIRWSPLVNAVVVVFVPILLVCISNALLILTIKKRQVPLLKETSEQASQQKTEQRVARTVILIVTSFTITQGPSAVLNVAAVFQPVAVPMLTFSTFFVILGKALTFVLFCTSSSSFRQRLLHKTKLIRRQTARGIINLPIISRLRKLTVLTQGDTQETHLMLSSRTSSTRFHHKTSKTSSRSIPL